jgi:DNA-binding IclR family transcriptional regulator
LNFFEFNERYSPNYMVPAVDRAARILLMLSSNSGGRTLAEIASVTGWHKSSIHKILMTLAHYGFLDRDAATKRYTLGIALVSCGQSVLSNLPVNNKGETLSK